MNKEKEKVVANLDSMSEADFYTKESELNDMKQHADKIIQGIKALTEKDGDRAIWELFQNAVDLSEHCEVTIKLTEEFLSFQHNGEPFVPKTLDCLFKQVSSKTLEEKKMEFDDEDPVGQYGTGFLTSHSFGKVVEIDGALKKNEGFVPLQRFRLDRTSDNWRTLGEKLSDLKQNVSELLITPAILGQENPKTIFRFFSESKTNGKRAVRAMASLRLILPYVMTLNNRLEKVKVIQKDGSVNVFTKKALLQEGIVWKSIIQINQEEQHISFLKSEDKRVTVILPFGQEYQAFDFDQRLPRLFLFYPLIGTQSFGANYLIHSRNFLPTEPRDGLHLSLENEDNLIETKANRILLKEATNLIFDFIQHHSSRVLNPVKLAQINFNLDSEDDSLNEYFVELKKQWTDRFTDFPLVETLDGNKKPRDSVFFKRELFESEEAFDAIYKLTSKFHKNITKKHLSEEWTKNVDEWDIEGIKRIGFEELADSISEIGRLEEFEINDLISFYNFIIKEEKEELFNTYQLLPNINGDFRLLSGLNKTIRLSQELIDIADVIQPDISQRLVNDKFALSLPLEEYTRKIYIMEINSEINQKIHDDTQISEIKDDFRDALIQLCSVVVSEDSKGKSVIVIQKICEFYELEYQSILLDQAKEDELDIRTAKKKLVRAFLQDMSVQEPLWVKENLEFLKEVIDNCKYDDYKQSLGNISVFPNQLYELKLQEMLFIDKDIPDDIKEMYNKVVKPSYEIKTSLVHSEFQSLLKNPNTKTVKDLTSKIEDNFYDSFVLEGSLDDNPFKPEILEVIGLFKAKSEEDKVRAKEYKSFYPRTSENKSKILVTLADGENTFSILSLDNNKIARLGALAQNPEELEKILNLGEDALKVQKQKAAEFKHKHKIGTHIEAVLRNGLTSIIPDNIKAIVKEEQDGQDIIIQIEEKNVFYIEVKSRWLENSPIRMSKNQTLRANSEKDRYALCSVDMVGYDGDNKYDVQGVEEIKSVTRFNIDIGDEVKHLIEVLSQTIEKDEIHLDGDYRTYIPHKYTQEGKTLQEFENYLIKFLKKSHAVTN